MPDERSTESGVSAVLYKRLLALATHDNPESLLEDAVRLIVEVTSAKLALVELIDAARQPTFWRGHGHAVDLDVIRGSISRGVVAHTLDQGRTVVTTSAMGDARFAALDSVKQHATETVLCTPIGAHPPIGALYLQGRVQPGPFSPADQEHAEVFAAQLALFAQRLLPPRRLADETSELHRRRVLETLKKHDGNVSETARELGVARSFIYSVVNRSRDRET